MALMTFDAAQIQSTGAFLNGELERLDQTLYLPLADYKWARDITLRTDVSITDDISSFVLTDFKTIGGATANGKNFIGKNTTEVAAVQVGSTKIAQPMNVWALSLQYSILELQKSIALGRSIDDQQYQGLKLKFQMDIDEQVYMGDKGLKAEGMLNQSMITPENATGLWAGLTPDQILEEVNGILNTAWENSAYAIVPTDMLLPPTVYGTLVSKKVSDAGNVSVIKYLSENSICNAQNGRPLNIQPSKWCTKAGASSTGRVMAYTNRNDIIRFPMVQLASTPLQYDGLVQKTVYYGALGVVEVVRPETISYLDGVC